MKKKEKEEKKESDEMNKLSKALEEVVSLEPKKDQDSEASEPEPAKEK